MVGGQHTGECVCVCEQWERRLSEPQRKEWGGGVHTHSAAEISVLRVQMSTNEHARWEILVRRCR